MNRQDNENIKVIARLRPPVTQGKLGPHIQCTGKTIIIQDKLERPQRTYTFDAIFKDCSTQEEIFNGVMIPIIENILAGYNCTIFAYGQFDTGKTFTTFGEKTGKSDSWDQSPNAGLIPRTISKLVDMLEAGNVKAARMSYLEIFNEELIDLFSMKEESRVKLFDDPIVKGKLVVEGQEKIQIHNKATALMFFEKGYAKRQVSSTGLNVPCSRSHTIFTIDVFRKESCEFGGDDQLYSGKLTIVDLAGGENVSRSGAVDKEVRFAGRVNQSLLTLNRVMTEIVSNSNHIPYRESKLTRLLQNSLGGSSKTTMIATLSPELHDVDETVKTLEYMKKAKRIVNSPQVNQMVHEKDMYKKLADELTRLRLDLIANIEEQGVYVDSENYKNILNGIEILNEEKQKVIQDIKALRTEKIELEANLEKTKKTLKSTEQKVTEISSCNVKLHDKIDRYVAIEDTNVNRNFPMLNRKIQESFDSVTEILKVISDESISYLKQTEILRRDTCEIGGIHSLFDTNNKTNSQVEELTSNLDSLLKLVTLNAKKLSQTVTSFTENINKESIKYNELNRDLSTNLIAKLNDTADMVYQTQKEIISESRSNIDPNIKDALKVNKRIKLMVENKKTCLTENTEILKARIEELRKYGQEDCSRNLMARLKQIYEIKEAKEKSIHMQLAKVEQLIDELSANRDAQNRIYGGHLILKSKFKDLQGKISEFNNDEFNSKLNKMNYIQRDIFQNVNSIMNQQRNLVGKIDLKELQQKNRAEWLNIQKKHLDLLNKTVLNNKDNCLPDVERSNENFKQFVNKIDTNLNAFKLQSGECTKQIVKSLVKADTAVVICGKEIDTIVGQQEGTINEFLITGIKEEIPTGKTPQRQEYHFQRHLEGTSPQAILLNRFRENLENEK